MEPLRARDVATMSDAEMSQFVRRYTPNGERPLPITGWDSLPEDEGNRLTERLEALQRDPPPSSTAYSSSLNSYDLDPTESGGELFRRDYERSCCNKLVDDGGRPVYPIDLRSDALRNPGEYREIIKPWRGDPGRGHRWNIFEMQWNDWQSFRRWQNDNRGIEDYRDSFEVFIECWKRKTESCYSKAEWEEYMVQIELDPSFVEEEWDHAQISRRRERLYHRERGCRGFGDYVKAVEHRLAQHDFTRPFELNEDPEEQDQLTTWIEYLNYKCWWLDKYTSDLKRREPVYDMGWQVLVDSKILKPQETKKYLRDHCPLDSRKNERTLLEEKLGIAESEVKRIYKEAQEDPNHLLIPKETRASMMKTASTRLSAVKNHLAEVEDGIEKMRKFLVINSKYWEAKKICNRQRLRKKWVLEQISLIDAEMAKSDVAKTAPDQRKSGSPKSTGSGISTETRETSPDIRIEMDSGAARVSKTKKPAARRSRKSASGPNVTGLRRSARIAARQQAARLVLESSTSLPGLRPSPKKARTNTKAPSTL